MSGKFMKVRRIAVSTLTVLMIASQLTGCAGVTKQEAADMMGRNDTIEIEIAEPSNNNSEAQLYSAKWVELGSLDTYPEFREKVDAWFGIEQTETGKTGCIYEDMNGETTNNSVFKYAVANRTFEYMLYEDAVSMRKLVELGKELYVDVETDTEALGAFIDAYFGLFNNGEKEFHGNQVLTRGEFLAGLYKTANPVKELEADPDFNYDSNSAFVKEMLAYSYIDEMDEATYNGTITRAEAVYAVMSMLYSEKLDNIPDGLVSEDFEDVVKGESSENHAEALSKALQNPDGGVPLELYKALVAHQVKDIQA